MKLGFLGGGNMAAAMIGGLRGGAAPEAVVVVERDAARRDWLQRELGVAARAQVDAALAGCDTIVLAVKPSDLEGACAALQAELGAGAGGRLLLSIAAGIPSASIARWCAADAVVRAMPNTPALIGQGITGMYARAGVSAGQRADAERILAGIGQAIWLDDEGLLDAVTAISGSGPAYVFYFIEALQDAAVRLGLAPDLAQRFALQTFVGAAQLAARSPEPVGVLRERVTSKGGTTAAALARLQADHVAEAIVAAARAARDRSEEMARQYGG